MGGGRTQSTGHEALRRWVWAANLNRPVGKNATLLFGRNGNLILADTNGRAVWQTQTANIGVTDINLLSNGNLVLLNKKGNFVWQSFDYPTNTLLNGQGLPDGSSRLVSGSYSMVVDYYPTLFFKTKRNPPMVYFSFTDFLVRFNKVNFIANGKQFDFFYAGTTGFDQYREDVWDHPGYNTTLSMLRLEKDGNLRVYTYNGFMKIWESPYSYLSSKSYECNLPEKCGLFGYCENQKCVSCPSSKGLLAASWNKECKREKTPHCKGTKSKVAYYRLENVSSSIRTANDKDYKKLSVDGCKNKCNEDCKCVGFFYRTEYGTCMVATTEMYTLTSDNIRWELGYIEPKVNTYIKYAK
ncbi:hypothetical protein MKW94_010784 [Papaver nudicaule]|uniref:Uncharacterized protein n=1 Tax=Papaver nudicaule TaxID=74823 RepID=A0AA41V975_PAPNU|nr:hypothetical protein [Papaver nudicaule]